MFSKGLIAHPGPLPVSSTLPLVQCLPPEPSGFGRYLAVPMKVKKQALPASVWVKVEAAAVEVDRGLEVLPVAEAAGGVPDPLDLRIQALGGRVGDPVAEVGEDVR